MSAPPTTTNPISPATPPVAAANSATVATTPVSDWSPLRNPIFRAMWIASAISYTGFEIRNYAAPALMQDFRGVFGVSNGMAAYTFTASTLPIPLLVLFAGALADVIDRRKLLILTHLGMMIAAGLLGILTIAHAITPWTMLGFLFVIGAGYAMMNPALLAVLPELVSPAELRSALALNGLNMNIARVLGPAIGGAIVVALGKAHFWAGKGIAFLVTAVSLSGVIWVLMNWKPPERKPHAHPESVWGAVRTSFRYTIYSPRLLAVLARVFLFIFCAGILPTFAIMICKNNAAKLHGDSGSAIWMVSLGIGAILGVYFMQALQRRFGIEEVVVVCTLAYGLAVLGVAHTPNLTLGCLAMFIAGFNWVIVPTNFNISTQLAVPAWIKGRAMGMYVLVLWGSFAAGSAVFGRLSTAYSPRAALSYAGIGVLIGAIPILWLRLVPQHKEDLTPAKRGPLPEVPNLNQLRSSPVAVSIDYRVAHDSAHDFRHLMHQLHLVRRRNGAVHWTLREAPGGNGLLTFVESFHFPSWADRVRSHDRTTKLDAVLEDQVLALHVGSAAPAMHHAPDPTVAANDCCAVGAFFHHTRDTFLNGVARELPRLFDRLHNARRYGWDDKTRPW
jgi:MFS family permease